MRWSGTDRITTTTMTTTATITLTTANTTTSAAANTTATNTAAAAANTPTTTRATDQPPSAVLKLLAGVSLVPTMQCWRKGKVRHPITANRERASERGSE